MLFVLKLWCHPLMGILIWKLILWEIRVRNKIVVSIRRSVRRVNQRESKATWSKFHRESSHNIFTFIRVATQYFVQQLWWHISLELYFYSMSAATWAGLHVLSWVVNKSTKNGFSSCKISFYITILSCLSNEWQQQWR